MTAIPVTQPRRTYGWRSWGEVAREVLLGMAVGVAVLIVEQGGRGEAPEPRGFLRNSILGACIITVARLLETALSWAIEQSRIPIIFRAVLYALGGWLGYLLGVGISDALLGVNPNDFLVGSYHFTYSIYITAMASIVVGFILHHNRKRNDRLRQTIERLKEHEFAEKELEIARAVQQRLLPPPEIDASGFHVSGRTEAAHIIGGDFYDVIRLDDGSVAVIVADVSGKGMAASLIMASCKTAMSLLASGSRDRPDVMRALNAKLCDDLQRREFVAMTYAHCNPSSGSVEIVNAGMPDPLLIGGDGSCRSIVCNGERLPLGIRPNRDYEKVTIELRDGDRLLLFSDGLPEACVGEEPIGYERIEEFAVRTRSIDDLFGCVRSLANVRIDDDATAVLVTRAPAPRPYP